MKIYALFLGFLFLLHFVTNKVEHRTLSGIVVDYLYVVKNNHKTIFEIYKLSYINCKYYVISAMITGTINSYSS